MVEALYPHRLLSFGNFEVDLQAGELRKAGMRLKLTGQPFQVLAILLERPGDVVTREELQKRLWPDTFVDFDHNLNAAINKIREVLGDSAENPRFVETLPRRGYRFIGDLNHENAKVPRQIDFGRLSTSTSSEKPDTADAVPSIASSRFRLFGLLASGLVVLAFVATITWLRRPQAPPKLLATTQLTKDGARICCVVTDGSRLYIGETRGTTYFLVQAAATGGETSPIPNPFSAVSLMDISPDHSQLLIANWLSFTSDTAEFWALPLPSGPPRRIADVTGSGGKWSPDGHQLVFSKGNDLYLANADGTDERKLLTLPHSVYRPKFSPDGTHIRFDVWDENLNLSSIWEVRTNGTNLRPLLRGWQNSASECCGAWSPDGRYFFFLSINAFQSNLWVLSESNSAFRKVSSRLFQLTAGPMLIGAMTPSPDGKKLFASGYRPRGELIRYDAQRREFVPFLSGIWAAGVSFSHDGKWVAYVSYPEGTLWRSRIDGSERLQLTNPPIFASMPSWSPDGKQIVFYDMQIGRTWKILLVSAQGGAAHEMLVENFPQVDPAWTPDGEHIVFSRDWSDEKQALQVLDLNSKHVSMIPGSQGLYSPRWSPDGRYMAALTDNAGKIVIFDFKTQVWSDWVGASGQLLYPVWSRDGKYLYFENRATETPGYYRIQIGKTRPELVVNLKDLHQFGYRIGTWSGITPDDSPLFVRDLGSNEIYSLDLELP